MIVPPSLEELTDRFLAFERATGAGSLVLGGCRVWDYLRNDIYHALLRGFGLFPASAGGGGSHWPLPRLYFRGFLRTLRKARGDNPTIILANPRRKLDPKTGKWVDPYTDYGPVRLLAGALLWEPRFGGVHRTPVPRPDTGYLDFPEIIASILRRPIQALFRIRPQEWAELVRVEASFKLWFGRAAGLPGLARRCAADRRARLPIYRLLLRWSRARELLLVCGYDKAALIEACQLENVRVIELQHGTISRFHLGYQYPQGSDKRLAPDELRCFGKYWSHAADFPSRTRAVVWGYPFLEESIKALSGLAKEDLILVISQTTIGVALSQVVLAALNGLPETTRILYKLHPTEVKGWRDRYPGLVVADSRIQVIEGDEPSLHELMAISRWQVGVYSTALLEGMRLGCRTVLIDLPGIEHLRSVVEHGDAAVAKDGPGLVAAIQSAPIPDGKYYFDHAYDDETRRNYGQI